MLEPLLRRGILASQVLQVTGGGKHHGPMVLQGAVSSCGQSIMHMCSKWPLCQGRTRDTASPYVSVAQGATHALQLELPDIMHLLKTMAYFFCLWSSVGRPFSWSGYCPFLSSHILTRLGSLMPAARACHAMPCHPLLPPLLFLLPRSEPSRRPSFAPRTTSGPKIPPLRPCTSCR